MLKGQNIQIAAQPIIWSNDDFHDLGGSTPLEKCLSDMREAGYAGSELGHKFPKNAAELQPILSRYNLSLVSGWHSSYLATGNLKSQIEDYERHLSFLKSMGCRTVIVAECTRRSYNDADQPLQWDFERDYFSQDEWKRIVNGLEEFAKRAEASGMKLAYHHHMGTGIQTLQQIDRLMNDTQKTSLLGDTGHLAFAGEEPLKVFEKYQSRLGHVHLKNVRPEIVAQAREHRWSFAKAVRAGVFTVPGDGGIDYKPLFALLKKISYSGWMVVEAEQDPAKANPLQYAKQGREHIRQLTGI